MLDNVVLNKTVINEDHQFETNTIATKHDRRFSIGFTTSSKIVPECRIAKLNDNATVIGTTYVSCCCAAVRLNVET